jgi:hypothetical protein
MTVEHRDRWLGKTGQLVENPVPVSYPTPSKVGRRQIAPGIDVCASAKGAIALCGEHNAPDVAGTVEFIEMAIKACEHLWRQ